MIVSFGSSVRTTAVSEKRLGVSDVVGCSLVAVELLAPPMAYLDSNSGVMVELFPFQVEKPEAAEVTVNVCSTGAAASYWLSPTCVAVIVALPAAMIVSVDPLTVATAGFELANVTGSEEVAVALRMRVVPAVAVAGSRMKVMDCVALATDFTVRTT